MIRRRRLALGCALPLAAALLAASGQNAAAQEPAPPSATAPAAAAPAGAGAPRTFASLGFGDRSVRGIAATASYFLPIAPGTRLTAPAILDLDLSWSPLLVPDLSTVTVAVGDVDLLSAALPADQATGRRVTVAVPPDLAGGDGLFVEVRFYLRTTRDDCEDPTNPAHWATVHDTSTLTLAGADTTRDLADLPDLLLPPGPSARATRLAVAGADDPDVLAAAGTAAFQVGRWAAAQHRDATIDVDLHGTVPGDAPPTLLVGTGSDIAAALPPSGSGTDAPVVGDGPSVGLTQSGPTVGVLSGSTPAEVREAATRLADPATAGALDGPQADLAGRAARLPERTDPWTDGAASFAQLGIARQEVAGPGTQILDLAIERPAGWRPDRSAHLDLRLDVGSALRSTSSVRAEVTGIDLGTRRLRPADGVQTLRFEVSGDQLDRLLDGRPQRRLDLHLTFQLAPDQRRCTPLDVEGLRVAVLPTSTWQVPHGEASALDLGRFPHPLLRGSASSEPEPVAVVLPADPDDTTVAAALQLAAALGRWAEPGSPPPLVATVDRLGDAASQRSLVLLGTADRDLGHALRLAAPAVARDGQAAAVLGLADSWAGDGHAVLAVHGAPEGLLLAARALAGREAIDRLRGAQVAVAGPLPQALVAADRATPPPSLAPVVDRRTDRGRVVVAVVLLGAFLAMLAAFVWFRWIRPRRRA